MQQQQAQVFERFPALKVEFDKRVQADPGVGTDPQKWRAFLQEMRQQGVIQGRGGGSRGGQGGRGGRQGRRGGGNRGNMEAVYAKARQQLNDSPRHGEWEQVESRGRKIDAFVVYPEVKDKAQAVVVIHEIFGMTDWVRAVADRLAGEGYIAIAPDLLSGMGPNGGNSSSFQDQTGVRDAIRSLTPEQVIVDLDAVTDYVTKLPAASGKASVVGYCWGGSHSFNFATHRKDLQAAFVFYGSPPRSEEAIARISCPVYGFYGGNDNRINATISDTEAQMKTAGKTYDYVIYEGAGHGFLRAGEDPGGAEANQKAKDEAWDRWIGLLKKL